MYSKLTDAEIERLSYLMEECGEVIQACSKIIRHGYESKNPDLMISMTNREDLEKEIDDVLKAINFMVKSEDVVMPNKYAYPSLKYFHHQKEIENAD